jgi:hypothetical protein
LKFSSYVEDSLKLIQASKPENDDDSSNSLPMPKEAEFKWFNIGSKVEIIGWNDQQNDFAYKITYIIGPYTIPATKTSFSKAPKTYSGAYKRYEYWLTGENAEVLKIEQQFDNAYFNTMYMGTAGPDGIPNNANHRTNVEQQGAQGVGTVTMDATITLLRDPNAYTKTKIQILGDPDYLMPDHIQGTGPYAEDGYTINPSSGQRFIEVAYREAHDYQNSTGALKINSNIQFFPYPKNVREKLLGAMSYMLVGVTSNFSKGSFTQDLNTVINTFPNDATKPDPISVPGRNSNSEGTAREAANANTTGTILTGSLANKVVPIPGNVLSVAANANEVIKTVQTAAGPVADGDANITTKLPPLYGY